MASLFSKISKTSNIFNSGASGPTGIGGIGGMTGGFGGGGGGGGGGIMSMMNQMLGISDKDAFGSRPKVPPFVTTDINAEQLAAINQNQAIFPQASQLSNSVNLFNADQTKALSERLLPGLLAQATENTGAQLRGELSQQTLSRLSNSTAAEASRLGIGGGSPFRLGLQSGNYLRSVEQLQAEGQKNFMQLQSLAQQQFTPSNMFIPPEKRLGFEYQQKSDQWGRNWLAEQTDKAASPQGQFMQDFMKSL